MSRDPLREYQGHFEVPRPTLPFGVAAFEGVSVGPTADPLPAPDELDRGAAALLEEAARIVEGARNGTHGAKERSFEMIAALWSTYLGTTVTGADVALLMGLLKTARARCGTPVRDHFVDLAGYAAIAGELCVLEKPLP